MAVTRVAWTGGSDARLVALSERSAGCGYQDIGQQFMSSCPTALPRRVAARLHGEDLLLAGELTHPSTIATIPDPLSFEECFSIRGGQPERVEYGP